MIFNILLFHNFQKNEQGSALVIALVMLLVLTLMAVAGMQTTSIQERMAGNLRDKNIAFQAAEASLREAEIFLQSAVLPSFEGNDGLYQPDQRSNWIDQNFWSNSTNSHEYEILIDEVAILPRYIIEELPSVLQDGDSIKFGEIPDIGMFRITARAVGGSDTSEVILQTIYRR